MSLAQSFIIYFISPLIGALIFLIVIQVVFSLLVGFGVVNLNHPTVRQLYYMLERVVAPILDPIRRILPAIGGFDFSPLIAILVLQWIQGYLLPSFAGMLG